MAQETLWEFSALSIENIFTSLGHEAKEGNLERPTKPSLIHLVQVTQFSGKSHEDAKTHLQNFLEITSTIKVDGVNQDIIRFCLFPFSLEGRAKKWFYTNKEDINTWTNCSKAFVAKFFSIGKFTKSVALRRKIICFQQQKTETIPEAWKRFKGYISKCPLHGMPRWLLIQTFHCRLTQKARESLDAIAEGSLFELTLGEAELLLDKIAKDQSWFQDKVQHHHQI